MQPGRSRLTRLITRHWGKLVVVNLIAVVSGTFLIAPARPEALAVWSSALEWAGLKVHEQSIDTIYWCPMHPQIKRKKANEVCPICSMALVPLEGDGTAEAPEHLTLTPQQVQQAGVVYEPVVVRKLYREIDTTGRVEYDERRLAGITSWIRGKSRIQKLHVNFTGTRVERGQLMAELYSPELITAQEEFLLTLESFESSNAGASGPGERNGPTASASLSPLSKYSRATKRMLESARRRLEYLGMTTQQIDQLAESREAQDRIPIYAPASGTVITRHVQEGQYVEEGDWLFHLADLRQLWIFVDIYEDELPLVHEGQVAEISVRSIPGETFQGTVAFVPPEIERETRTARVRIDVPNPDRRLKPGSYARVRLRKELGSRLAVPHNAVLWSGQRQVAIVRMGEGIFQPRQIRIDTTWAYPSETPYQPGGRLEFGADHVRYHPVLAGLRAGEEVVTSGAFLLNAESQFQSVLTKMLPPESRAATLEDAVGAPLAEAIRALLDAYFGLVEVLAADDLKTVAERAGAVEQSAARLARSAESAGNQTLRAQAERLGEIAQRLSTAPAEDLKKARTEFGRVSRQLVALLADNGGQTLLGRELFYFRCGMAKVGYENWLWWSPDKHNPYMGQKMLTCGTPLETLKP